jgi:hypothetical protein
MDTDATKTYNFKTDFELKDTDYKLTELWNKQEVKNSVGKITLTQPAHSVKVIEFVKK